MIKSWNIRMHVGLFSQSRARKSTWSITDPTQFNDWVCIDCYYNMGGEFPTNTILSSRYFHFIHQYLII